MQLVLNKTMLGSILRITFYTIKKSSESPLQFVDHYTLKNRIGSLYRQSKYTFYLDDCHFNINGALKVSEILFSCIKENTKKQEMN